jgi:hypothetical protein
LQSAGQPQGKFFVQDLGADGFPLEQTDAAHSVDVIYESMTTRTVFDNDWTKQGLSEQQYRIKRLEADRRYAGLLEALLAQAKEHTVKSHDAWPSATTTEVAGSDECPSAAAPISRCW